MLEDGAACILFCLQSLFGQGTKLLLRFLAVCYLLKELLGAQVKRLLAEEIFIGDCQLPGDCKDNRLVFFSEAVFGEPPIFAAFVNQMKPTICPRWRVNGDR